MNDVVGYEGTSVVVTGAAMASDATTGNGPPGSLRGTSMAHQANPGFEPGNHWGSASNLIVRWSKGCGCWQSTGPFTPSSEGRP